MSFTSEQKLLFLSRASFSGLCATYSLALSIENSQAFKMEDIFEDIIGDLDYCFGFIVACSSFDLFDYNMKNNVLTVKYIHLTSKEIKTKLTELNLKSSFKENNEKVILDIESFFS